MLQGSTVQKLPYCNKGLLKTYSVIYYKFFRVHTLHTFLNNFSSIPLWRVYSVKRFRAHSNLFHDGRVEPKTWPSAHTKEKTYTQMRTTEQKQRKRFHPPCCYDSEYTQQSESTEILSQVHMVWLLFLFFLLWATVSSLH